MPPAMKWMAKKTGEGEESKDHWGWSWDAWGWWEWEPKWKGEKGDKVKEKGGKSKGKGETGQGSQGSEKPKGKSKGKQEEDRKGEKGKNSEQCNVLSPGFKGFQVKVAAARSVPVTGAKMVTELEAELAKGKGKIERVKRADAGGKQPIEAKGTTCQVHKHSGMGCAVVSVESATIREAIMNYAEKTFGKSEKGKLEMDIADVKVQLKRHTDKTTKQEVVTDIFVAWGHQQEKDSPLTVHEIAERFDKLYQDAMAVEAQGLRQDPHHPHHAPGTPGPVFSHPGLPGLPGLPGHPGHPGHPGQANPYYNAMLSNMMNPAGAQASMNPCWQQYMAQQAAMAAYQQQLVQMYASFPASGKFGKAAKGKGPGPAPVGVPRAEPPASGAAALPADVPDADVPDADADDEEAKEEATADFAPPKPRLLQIVDPHSGKPIDTMGMNFAPRKPSTPLQITNPNTGEAVMS